jgi:hypothetical protein
VRDWHSFDAWKDGDWIGRRANGELVCARHEGWIV